MSKILKKLLVQGADGQQSVDAIAGSLIKATTGETFETHSQDSAAHVPGADADGKLLASQDGDDPKWIDKSEILKDAALTGTPTAPTAGTGTNTEQIANTAFVTASVAAAEQKLAQQLANGVRLKGNIGGEDDGDLKALPESDVQVGDGYYVKVAGTYGGHVCEVGDTIICRAVGKSGSNPEWFVLQKNLINAITGPSDPVVEGNLVGFAATTGGSVKDSGISGTDVSDAVAKKHAHINSETLAKFGESSGNPTFNGNAIGAVCKLVASVEEATSDTSPVGSLFLVVEEEA